MSDVDDPLTAQLCRLSMSFHCQQKTEDYFHQLELWNKPMRHAFPECDNTLGAYLATCDMSIAHFKMTEIKFHFEKKASIILLIIIMNFLLKNKQSLPSNQSTYRSRVRPSKSQQHSPLWVLTQVWCYSHTSRSIILLIVGHFPF